MRALKLMIVLTCLMAAGCATRSELKPAPNPGATTTQAATPTAFEKSVTRGRVVIAGQPTLEDLTSLKGRGIERVFNVRTAEEMTPSELGFDEAKTLTTLGIDYDLEPIGGSLGFRPQALEAFKQMLDSSSGTVLLHCASGARASMLYAAYEVKYLGKSPDQALRDLEPFGVWPLPLEKLTGIPLQVELRDTPGAVQAARH